MRQQRLWPKLLLALFILTILFFVWATFQIPARKTEANGGTKHYKHAVIIEHDEQQVIKQQQQQQQEEAYIDVEMDLVRVEDTIESIGPETGEALDKRWSRVLRNEKIQYISRIPAGLSHKVRVDQKRTTTNILVQQHWCCVSRNNDISLLHAWFVVC
jgi:hypothetical protein